MPNNEYANEPNQSRSEDIIQSILDNTEYDEEARSRIEYLLIELKNAIEGGGGGGGVTSYAPLTEKPKIDNYTLQAGNNTSSDLGLQTKLTFDSAPTESSTNPVTSGGIYTALDGKANSSDVYNKSAVDTALTAKADKSTTYTKSEVDTALSSKQNTISDLPTIRSGAALGATAVQPVSGKGLSTNDYTTAEKTKLAGIDEGAEVNEIEGIKVNNTTVNPDANKTVNITGLQTELSETNKLNPAYINYDSTHRAVSDAEKSEWNGKQSALSSTQLSAVNSGIDSSKVAQIETNKNNILSNTLNGGGINKFQVTATTTTVNGITFTVNADKTITATGSIADSSQNAIFTLGAYTAVSGDVLSEGLEEANPQAYIYARGGSTSLYSTPYRAILDGDIGVQRNYACAIAPDTVGQVNITFKPMICNSDSYAKSGVYQPFALSNVELTTKEQANENNILSVLDANGTKNQLDYTLASLKAINSRGTWVNNVYTVNNVKYTVNSDMSITAETIGTPSGSTLLAFKSNVANSYVGAILSGCPTGGNNTTYNIAIEQSASPYTLLAQDTGLSATIPNNTSGNIIIYVVVKTTLSEPIVFKPMICSADLWSISHQYQPYAMTNAEITAWILAHS